MTEKQKIKAAADSTIALLRSLQEEQTAEFRRKFYLAMLIRIAKELIGGAK
jgi:hypothetical protein